MENIQQSTGATAALNAAYPSADQRRQLSTIPLFSERYLIFSPSALRNLVFKAEEREGANGKIPGNGLLEAGAIVRIGRKVLIDEDKFFEWVDAQNKRGADMSATIKTISLVAQRARCWSTAD